MCRKITTVESRDIYIENRILKSGNDERMMRLYTIFSEKFVFFHIFVPKIRLKQCV